MSKSTLTHFAPKEEESLKIKKTSREFMFEASLRAITFKEGDFFIVYLPSLRISGYGESMEEAKESVDFAVNSFVHNLQRLSRTKVDRELYSLGWSKNKISTKEFSHAYVDTDGILKNIDVPEKSIIKDELLEWAV